jgi:hypothetical protein
MMKRGDRQMSFGFYRVEEHIFALTAPSRGKYNSRFLGDQTFNRSLIYSIAVKKRSR